MTSSSSSGAMPPRQHARQSPGPPTERRRPVRWCSTPRSSSLLPRSRRFRERSRRSWSGTTSAAFASISRARGPRIISLTLRPPTMATDDDEIEDEQLVLGDLLNHVLDKGVVIGGTVTISVADIDLIVLDLRLLLTSVETAVRRNIDRTLTQLTAGGAPST